MLPGFSLVLPFHDGTISSLSTTILTTTALPTTYFYLIHTTWARGRHHLQQAMIDGGPPPGNGLSGPLQNFLLPGRRKWEFTNFLFLHEIPEFTIWAFFTPMGGLPIGEQSMNSRVRDLPAQDPLAGGRKERKRRKKGMEGPFPSPPLLHQLFNQSTNALFRNRCMGRKTRVLQKARRSNGPRAIPPCLYKMYE
jgi:hypothetical protein